MLDVSVIVATFRSGPALDRTLASLDAQTLAPDRFEVRFVDDGSDDGTVDRLRAWAATRPHVHVTQIAPSGWPSRPRNVAIDEAAGEYVLFMDHDDELFPRGLERAVATAREHDADAVNVKEVKTTGWGAGWQTFFATNGDAVPLNPMTPHKLYRTALLREHGIRFPEGRRVLWEDIDFNIAVMRHARRIVRLDEPVYRWVIDTGANHSRTYHDDVDAYFTALERVLRCAHEQLDTPALRPLRDRVLLGNLELRLLRHLGPAGASRTEEFRRVAPARIVELAARYVPASIDERLGGFDRARAHLVRHGTLDDLAVLAAFDAGIAPHARLLRGAWTSSGLDVTLEARWTGPDGGPLVLDERDGMLLRPLPQDVRERLPSDVLDASRWLDDAEVDVTVRGRRSRDALRVPTAHEVRAERTTKGTSCTLHATATVPLARLRNAGDGRPERWDLAVRQSLGGATTHGRLTGAANADLRVTCAIVDGQAVRAAVTGSDGLALEPDPTRLAGPGGPRLGVRPAGMGRMRVVLDGLAATASAPATVVLGTGPDARRHEAQLVPAHGGSMVAVVARPRGAATTRVGVTVLGTEVARGNVTVPPGVWGRLRRRAARVAPARRTLME